MLTLTEFFHPTHSISHTPSFFERLRTARALARQRRALADLDDAQLRDIGLTRDQAHREAERPAWDAPHHWIC